VSQTSIAGYLPRGGIIHAIPIVLPKSVLTRGDVVGVSAVLLDTEASGPSRKISRTSAPGPPPVSPDLLVDVPKA
jgi:hypothetical protein